ncbi:MAG: peptidoglycan editing factor PgeF [Oscillospiraceae bacterium]|nr:peptidoglycan editing factor PgeF [Oscillospiraceae bacterium]
MGITEHNQNGLVYLTADSFEAAGGVVHAFSTRKGGVSKGTFATLNLGIRRGDDPNLVRENYRILCGALGLPLERIVCSNQVHGNEVRTVTRKDAGKGLFYPVDYETDGLVTNQADLPLAVFSADCIPILLYDPVSQSIGAVHAGWRGTALKIAALAVEKMGLEYGAASENILAAVGPGLSQCCFESDGDVPDAMERAYGAPVRRYIAKKGRKWYLDLKGINAHCLESAGVPAGHISVSEDCTRCHPEKYWSHRATGKDRGSMAAVISLKRKGI